jgi:hypothetical protein
MKQPPDDEITGLPGLKNWGQVYTFVLVVLVVWIGLLTAITRMYP